MEYVFGLDGCRTLMTKGAEHTNLAGYTEVVREFADCTITDNFFAVAKTNSAEDSEGSCYDWYIINEHYRMVDKTPAYSGRVEALEAENARLKAQNELQAQQQTFLEDCILEMGSVVYA
jgi:hypothetical protein